MHWDYRRGTYSARLMTELAAQHGVPLGVCLKGIGIDPESLDDPGAEITGRQELDRRDDDATRARALKIYRRHTQANAIDFINYVVDEFPFRIQTIRTDRGHEFRALFHWHVADLGMEHVYIKPRTPQLNGKVERSHLLLACAVWAVEGAS